MLCSRLLREHQENYLALAKKVRKEGLPRPYYFYVSIYRPLTWSGWDKDLEEPVYVHHTPSRSFVGTRKPIPLSEVRRLELVPYDQRTKAQVVIDFATEQGVPVEITSEDDRSTALLFKNPRGKWQLSFFELEIGPVGHLEGENPVELVADAIGRHCRWTPGRVEAIVASLKEES